VVSGAIRHALAHPGDPGAIPALVDTALGTVARVDAWGPAGQPAAPADAEDGFLTRRAVVEAVIIGALLER
jgi:hypothetical protein